MSAKRIVQAARNGGGKAVTAGIGVSGAKEVLDWLWEVGLQVSYPILYEFIHLQFVDAAIMAGMVTAGAWLAGRR